VNATAEVAREHGEKVKSSADLLLGMMGRGAQNDKQTLTKLERRADDNSSRSRLRTEDSEDNATNVSRSQAGLPPGLRRILQKGK